jgi:hypothetical protein
MEIEGLSDHVNPLEIIPDGIEEVMHVNESNENLMRTSIRKTPIGLQER